MTAAALFRELTAADVRLTVRDDHLAVNAPAGTITPELRQRIIDNKADLIEAANRQAMRDRLLALADRLGLPAVLVHRLDDADLAACDGLTGGQLRVYLSMLRDTATRQAGKVPLDDTAAIYCQHCGPVYAHPAVAAVLPEVNGWPRALGCPWCAIRKAGDYIPRPPITCAACLHFKMDTINPATGMGTCTAGHGAHWAVQPHRCGHFNPRATP